MSTAPMTSAHAMALPSPVVWRCACCPVGSLSTFQPKIAATQREQMVPPQGSWDMVQPTRPLLLGSRGPVATPKCRALDR